MDKMKILRVINSLSIGGAERSIVVNVPKHIQRGFEMDVLLLDGNPTFFRQELLDNSVSVSWLGLQNNIYNPFYIFKIAKLFKKYDVVHAHLFPTLYWVALAKILTKSKIKLVYTEHSTYNKRRDYTIFNWLDRFLYKQYNAIIAISPEANVALSQHLKRNDIITIFNGVDLSQVRIEAKKDCNELSEKYKDKKLLVQVAGFRSSKDQDTVIKCLTLLPNEYIAVFVGDGERMTTCKKMVDDLGLKERVVFLGLQKNVGAILNLAHIVIMSSHWEGFGRAAIEGMALGKPVIATNVSGLADIVRDAGLLFDTSDTQTLKELILKLEALDFYSEISKKCAERATEYDIDKMISAYELIYNKINE